MDINDTDEVMERRLNIFTNHLYNLNLSALNGLREDLNKWTNDMGKLSKREINFLINKWFDIDEAKKE